MYGGTYILYDSYLPYRPGAGATIRAYSPNIIISAPRPSPPRLRYQWKIIILNKWIIKFQII